MRRLQIKVEPFRRKILTFGSCLSQRAADNLSEIYGAETSCVVFNNRSDMFIRNFLEGGGDGDLPLELARVDAAVGLDEVQKNVFCRQKRQYLGLFDAYPVPGTQRHRTLWQCLESRDVGLVIADNYADMTAKDVFVDEPDLRGVRFFLNKRKTGQDRLIVGDYLGVEESAENLNRIVAFLRESFPEARVVFLCFPYETYGERPEVAERFRRFDGIFSCGAADLVVEAHALTRQMHWKVRQHFNPRFYAALAGHIYQCLA